MSENIPIAAYIRVSTDEQDPERQFQDIKERYNVQRKDLYADVEHGDVFTGRAGYDELIEQLDDYGYIVVDEVTRLGRSAKETLEIVEKMHEHDVTLIDFDLGIEFPPDDSNIASDILLYILAKIAEDELRRIRRRTKAGIRQAKREGKHVGQVPKGFKVEEGFLVPEPAEYERVCEFVREVNKGRPKANTAEYFGFKRTSAQTILETTAKEEYDYDVRYIGDDEWRMRRAEAKSSETDLQPLVE